MFDHINELLVTPLVLHIPAANYKFTLEGDTSRTTTGVAHFSSSMVNG